MLNTIEDIAEEIVKVEKVYYRLIEEATKSPYECIVRLFVVKKNEDVIGIFASKSDVCYHPLPNPSGPFVHGYKYFVLAQQIFRGLGFNEDYATYDDEVEFMLKLGKGEWNHKKYLEYLNERIKNGEIKRNDKSVVERIKENIENNRGKIKHELEEGFIEQILRNYPFTSSIFQY